MKNKKKFTLRADRASQLVRKEMWESALRTQMHFNEMASRTRQLGLGFVVAALALAATIETREPVHFLFGEIRASAIIVMICSLGLAAVGFLDFKLYNNMLRGAVAFGQELENDRTFIDATSRTRKGMTTLISEYSRYGREVPVDAGAGIPAQHNLKIFYLIVVLCLWGIAGLIQFSPSHADSTRATASQAGNAVDLLPEVEVLEQRLSQIRQEVETLGRTLEMQCPK